MLKRNEFTDQGSGNGPRAFRELLTLDPNSPGLKTVQEWRFWGSAMIRPAMVPAREYARKHGMAFILHADDTVTQVSCTDRRIRMKVFNKGEWEYSK